MKTISTPLTAIRIDGGTQPRTGIDESVVQEYAQRMLAGDEFPPLDVFFDGTDTWLASGFHRYFAHKAAGAVEVPVVQHAGTRRDAILFAVGTNADHGLRRTNDDKRRAVRLLLEDAEWGQWSNSEIARRCYVAHSFVAKLRDELTVSLDSESSEAPAERRYTTKHGTEATMATARIGKRPAEGSAANVATPREQPTSGPATTTRPDSDDGPSAAELLDELNADLRRAETRVAELEKALKDGGKAHVAQLVQRLDQAERTRDDAMENARRWQMTAERYERLLARCGKAVGDRDLDNVAPKVEAMARKLRDAKVAA